MQTAFITGCASGFGARLAARLLTLGWKVIATDPQVDRLDPLAHARCLRLALDVRQPDHVTHAVTAALAWSPVDLLVNNGGYAIFGTQEELDVEEMRDLFDVNVFGAARVTRALLPTLRDRAGTIVQLSSVAGRTVFPESGWYAATKYATEALSEALFQEACSFGVRMRVVEPGSFATNFLPSAIAASPARDASSPYAALHTMWDARKTAVLEPPQDPERVIDAIVQSLDDDVPFRRVVVGPDAERMIALRELLGADSWSRLAGQRNGLDAPPYDGDVLPARAVLGVWATHKRQPAELIDALEPTLYALHFGHLNHWDETEHGRAALEILHAVVGPASQ